jgi:hypothetical protein
MSFIIFHNDFKRLGHQINVFILLDNRVNQVKQTFWNYDYSNSLYGSYNEETLLAYLNHRLDNSDVKHLITFHIRLEEPSRDNFDIVGM